MPLPDRVSSAGARASVPTGYNPSVIITATRFRHVPAWYSRRVMREVQRLVAGNPGFHRLVIELPVVGAAETGYLVNPDVEPEVRRLLRRVLVLAEPVEDADPWPQL